MAEAQKKGIWQKYQVSGDKAERSLKSCPKCGQGFFMAQHKERTTCGTCGYTEFSKKEPKEAKK